MGGEGEEHLGVLGRSAPDTLGRLEAVGADRDGELLLARGGEGLEEDRRPGSERTRRRY